MGVNTGAPTPRPPRPQQKPLAQAMADSVVHRPKPERKPLAPERKLAATAATDTSLYFKRPYSAELMQTALEKCSYPVFVKLLVMQALDLYRVKHRRSPKALYLSNDEVQAIADLQRPSEFVWDIQEMVIDGVPVIIDDNATALIRD